MFKNRPALVATIFGAFLSTVLIVALAAGDKNRKASDLITEGFELCGGGVTEVQAVVEVDGGTLTATLDCGTGPGF